MLIVLFALWSAIYWCKFLSRLLLLHILWPDHRSQPHFFFTAPPTKSSNNGVLSNLTLPLTSSCLVHLNPSLTVKKNNCSPFVNNGNSTEGFQLLGPSPVYCIIPLTNGIDLDANIVFWVGVGRIKHEFYCNGIQYIGLNCYFESDCYRSKKW